MAGTIRDRLKTRTARLGEVLGLAHLKAGQANGQVIISGLTITKGGTSNRQVLVAAGEVVMAGVIKTFAAVTATSLPAGATTDASTYRKVLLEQSAAGALSFVVGAGAAAQADAPLPPLSSDKIAIGYVELPASFTVDTTSLTDAMIKQGPGTLTAFNAA